MSIESNIQHCRNRGLELERYSSITVFDDAVLFWIYNLSGQIVGYQQYIPDAPKNQNNDPRTNRYYTSLHGDKYTKPMAMWGLDTFWYREDVLIICEGIFDAVPFHNLGIPAVALLNNSSKPFRNWLYCVPRKIYQAVDDHASRLGDYEKLIPYDGYEDFGEMPIEFTKQLLSNKGI